MKLATTPEEQRRWMEQWRNAAVAQEEVKRMELMELTEEEAWRRTEALLSLPKPWRRPDAECGNFLCRQPVVCGAEFDREAKSVSETFHETVEDLAADLAET